MEMKPRWIVDEDLNQHSWTDYGMSKEMVDKLYPVLFNYICRACKAEFSSPKPWHSLCPACGNEYVDCQNWEEAKKKLDNLQ